MWKSRVYVSRQIPVYLSQRIPNNVLRNQMPTAEFFHIVIVIPALKRHGGGGVVVQYLGSQGAGS